MLLRRRGRHNDFLTRVISEPHSARIQGHRTRLLLWHGDLENILRCPEQMTGDALPTRLPMRSPLIPRHRRGTRAIRPKIRYEALRWLLLKIFAEWRW